MNDEEFKKAPHTFVFHRGVIGKNLLQLMLDMRRVMEPYTAATLRVRMKYDSCESQLRMLIDL